MTKLLICDDRTLKSRKGPVVANIELIKEFIGQGNRFLLTTNDSLYGFLDDDYDDGWIAFIQPSNLLRIFDVRYTEISCLNGIYLYNERGRLINSYPLSNELRQKLKEVPQKKNLHVDVTEYVPDYGTMDDDIVGKLKIHVAADYKKKYLGAKNYIRKIVKEAGDDICHTVSFYHDKYHSATYNIWSSEATEANQIKYVMDRNHINQENVLDLRGTDPKSLNPRIREFGNIVKKKKRW